MRHRVRSLGMNERSHMMHVHHLLIGVVCALMLTGCVGTQYEMKPMDHDGTYYLVSEDGVGTWETTGSDRTDGRPCTWTRSVDAPLTVAGLEAMGHVARGETARVTLPVSGQYFRFSGCKPWHMVS